MFRRDNRVYGYDISESVYYTPEAKDSLNPKCNSVSFFKPEQTEVRNGVAVSDRFISYVVKGNLLRVIETVTAEKALLKGHKSQIVDVSFSNVDTSTLCSVDMGLSSESIFVWKLINVEDKTILSSEIVNKYSVPACIVKPHSTQSGIWAVSDGTQLAIFHVDQSSSSVKSYSDFNIHKTFPDLVQGSIWMQRLIVLFN